MADSGTPSDRWPPIHFYRYSLVSIVCFVVSAASFVGAVFLFTYCIPVVINGFSTCIYAHWLAASFFVAGGALFLILGIVYGAFAWISLEPERYRRLRADLAGKSLEKAPQSVSDVLGPVRPP
jgi:energy-coupling factor transporter transmembrane protein EcfT